MSFEAFVQCFSNGEFGGIPKRDVRAAFGSFLSDDGPFDWRLYYDEENNCDVMLDVHKGKEHLLRGFTVLRPCGDKRFWDAMVVILRLGNLVLYFPARCPPLIARKTVARHLPEGLIESFGPPKVVSTADEILKALHKS